MRNCLLSQVHWSTSWQNSRCCPLHSLLFFDTLLSLSKGMEDEQHHCPQP